MPVRNADAQWEGNLANGRGRMALGSGAFEGPFSFKSRFEEGEETNPEELLGAAHAGCFSMAFSNELSEAGHTPVSVQTQAKVRFEVTDDGPAITRIDLTTRGRVPGISEDEFQRIAEAAKENCPVSKLFQGAPIELAATLES